jgi:hypothetical protein
MKKQKIEQIQNGLANLVKLSEQELNELSYTILKEVAGEYTKVREDFFISKKFKEDIIKFNNTYALNLHILRNILGSMGFVATQFNDYDDIYYDCLLKNTKNIDNKIKMIIARFICNFPQFENNSNKWDYILSIAKIPPKKHSIDYFFFAVKDRLEVIPSEYKNEIIKILSEQIPKINWADTRKLYENLIGEIRRR